MSTLFNRCLLTFLAVASTAEAQVLLEKVKKPGFVTPEYAITTRCTLSDTGLLTVQHQLGTLVSKRNSPSQLTVAATKTAINAAALGEITSSNIAVDGPTILYRAYQKRADGSVKPVLLHEENGGTGVKKINNAEAAILLRNFIDLNCGDSLL